MSQTNAPVDFHRYAKILSRTPDLLRTLLECFPDALLGATYGAETSSVRGVLGCMIYEEQHTWIPGIQRIMSGREIRALEFIDHNGRTAPLRNDTVSVLLARFASLREANLAELQSLSLGPGDLARRGRHPMLGLVSLAELLATWMVHDLCHVSNICKALALQRSQETGPWQAYLSILIAPTES
jgi:hypothetical protein